MPRSGGDRSAASPGYSRDNGLRDRVPFDAPIEVVLPVRGGEVAVLEKEELDLPEARGVDLERVGPGPVLAVHRGDAERRPETARVRARASRRERHGQATSRHGERPGKSPSASSSQPPPQPIIESAYIRFP